MFELKFDETNARLGLEIKDWKEAIKVVAGLLVENNHASEEYIEGIFKMIEEYGPYIVIADGIAIPHASSDYGVKDVGCSLITLKEPIYIENSDIPVRVLISFCALEGNEHMSILKMIVNFIEEGMIDRIVNISNLDELQKMVESSN